MPRPSFYIFSAATCVSAFSRPKKTNGPFEKKKKKKAPRKMFAPSVIKPTRSLGFRFLFLFLFFFWQERLLKDFLFLFFFLQIRGTDEIGDLAGGWKY